MRKLLFACLLLLPLEAAFARTYRVDEVPDVQRADRMRYVSNPDGILSEEAVARIDSLCAALRSRGIAQVAVVAVDDIAGGDPFTFAVELFTKWGVGRSRDDNGLGVLLVKDLHEIRFVTGGGLEGVLPDAICKRIQLRYMLPDFRRGDYNAGMTAGIEAVAQVLEGSELDLGQPDEEEVTAWTIFGIVLGIGVIPAGLLLVYYYRRKRCPRCGALALELESQQTLEITKHYDAVEYTFVCRKCGHIVKRRQKHLKDDGFGNGTGGGMIVGGGRGIGGGSFGGGGGFGGGSFGGGGAGSRW